MFQSVRRLPGVRRVHTLDEINKDLFIYLSIAHHRMSLASGKHNQYRGEE